MEELYNCAAQLDKGVVQIHVFASKEEAQEKRREYKRCTSAACLVIPRTIKVANSKVQVYCLIRFYA